MKPATVFVEKVNRKTYTAREVYPGFLSPLVLPPRPIPSLAATISFLTVPKRAIRP